VLPGLIVALQVLMTEGKFQVLMTIVINMTGSVVRAKKGKQE
jgi:hypothetical protein